MKTIFTPNRSPILFPRLRVAGSSFITFGLIAVSSSLLSAATPISRLTDVEVDQLWQTAEARCRAAFATESGNPDDPRNISRQDPNKVQELSALIGDWLEKTPVVFPRLS